MEACSISKARLTSLLNNNGHSALHKAAVKGQRQACEWLVRVAGLSLPHMVWGVDVFCCGVRAALHTRYFTLGPCITFDFHSRTLHVPIQHCQ